MIKTLYYTRTNSQLVSLLIDQQLHFRNSFLIGLNNARNSLPARPTRHLTGLFITPTRIYLSNSYLAMEVADRTTGCCAALVYSAYLKAQSLKIQYLFCEVKSTTKSLLKRAVGLYNAVDIQCIGSVSSPSLQKKLFRSIARVLIPSAVDIAASYRQTEFWQTGNAQFKTGSSKFESTHAKVQVLKIYILSTKSPQLVPPIRIIRFSNITTRGQARACWKEGSFYQALCLKLYRQQMFKACICEFLPPKTYKCQLSMVDE